MAGIRDTLTRKTGPKLIIASAGVKAPQRMAAARLRKTGGRERVELFCALDDPLSAVALIGLSERLKGRRVELVVLPVVSRGMEGDPAIEWKRKFSVIDATRLAARDGIRFKRDTIVQPSTTKYLAEWISAREPATAVTNFAIEASRQIWVDGVDPADEGHFAELWDRIVGGTPPGPGTGRIALNQSLMKKRGPYDTPAACLRGQWFFAHERLDRIAQTLDELGWKAGA